MENIKKIKNLLTFREKKNYFIITFFLFFNTFLEMFSIALIIPVFNIVFMNKIPSIEIFNYFYEKNISENFIKILILLLTLLAFAIKNFFSIFYNYYTLDFFYKFNARIKNKIINFFLNQNYSFFLSKKSENVLLKTFVYTENLRKYLVSFQILLTESLFLMGMISILLYINLKIFLYLFSIFFFIFIFYFKTFKIKIERWSKDANDNIAISQNLLIEGVRGIKDLIIYGLSNFFLERFEKSVESESRANYKLEFLNIVSKYWIEVLVVFAISSCLIFIIILNNSIDRYLPIFTLFAVAIFRIVPTMNRLLANYQIAKFYKSSLDGVHDSLFSSSDYTINNDTNNIVFDKCIEFRKVSYSYNRDSKFILNNIDFKILKKEKVCILGKNGSGKSTLLNLISGLLSPTSGEIYIDSFNLLKINNCCWFKNISHVHQDVFLLNNTIKNNIILSHGIEYNESKFNMVTDLLSLNSLFGNLSDGLNTRVGDAGSALSGGQKQLISLARALYKDSDILILDEPTSALDINYISVFKNLLVKLENKTIIIVTHDKSLDNQYFDKIFEIKNGQLNLTYVKK